MATILESAPHLHHMVSVSGAPASGSAGITALEIVTLVIAVVGALTGVAALVWQATAFALAGGRVATELKVAWFGAGGAVVADPATWPAGKPPAGAFHDESYAIVVRSVGRLPVTVTSWGLKIGPTMIGQIVAPWNPALPHRLEVGEEAKWFVPRPNADAMADALKAMNVGGKPAVVRGRVPLRASVTLGDGRTVESPATYLDVGR